MIEYITDKVVIHPIGEQRQGRNFASTRIMPPADLAPYVIGNRWEASVPIFEKIAHRSCFTDDNPLHTAYFLAYRSTDSCLYEGIGAIDTATLATWWECRHYEAPRDPAYQEVVKALQEAVTADINALVESYQLRRGILMYQHSPSGNFE